MDQLSDNQQRAHLERMINARLDEIISPLTDRLDTLEAPVFDSADYNAPPNYLPNSAPEWSTLAYTIAGTAAGTVSDANRNCYNWYYQTAAATNLSGVAAALLASGHSGFAGLNADAPIWDATNATFKLGSDTTLYDVSAPLPTDFVFPGMTFYVYFEASLAAGAVNKGDSQQVYCGFWDDTAGQEKWIEGSDFTPTISVFGSPGSRTLKYKILAATDSGTQILSTELTTTAAPATLTSANHVRLFFTGAPGFIYYGIYRKTGSTYKLVHEIRNSIDLQFYDMDENAGSPQPAYPTLSANRPQAYALSETFEPGALSSTDFTPHTMTIKVPTTYNRGNTANAQQWFRFGLTDLMGSSSDRRGIVIRRIMVSEGYGAWTRSPLDMQAASGPTGTATSSPGSGTPIGGPPIGGSGGPSTCVTLDMETEIVEKGEKNATIVKTVTMGEVRVRLENREKVYISLGGFAFPIQKFGIGKVQFVWYFECENGVWFTCSDTQAIFYSQFGKRLARHFKEGDLILTKFGQSPVVKKGQRLGEAEVMWITLPKPHQFVVNGAYLSNEKPISPDIF